jgi:hypothetical protein
VNLFSPIYCRYKISTVWYGLNNCVIETITSPSLWNTYVMLHIKASQLLKIERQRFTLGTGQYKNTYLFLTIPI